MNNYLRNLSNTQKGAILIASGLILLLFLMGVFRDAFYYLILIASLLLIGAGIIVGDFWTKARTLIQKKNK